MKLIEISLIGLGTHVRKNLLGAFNRSTDVTVEGIYVRDKNRYQELDGVLKNLKSLEDLENSKAKWAYIATPLSTHYALVKRCLSLGMNVICEKPLTDNIGSTESLFLLAMEKQLVLTEVDMYRHHLQYEHLSALICSNIEHIRSVKAEFSIPHLDPSDFRYSTEGGGGALFDVGYYPISIILDLFGYPKSVTGGKFVDKRFGIDTSGTATLFYNDFYCLTEWGFGKHYCNRIEVCIGDRKYEYPRIFSKPYDYNTVFIKSDQSSVFEEEIGQDDQFVNMISKILRGNYFNQVNAINYARVIQNL